MAQANDSFFERSDFPTGIYVAASEPVIEIVVDDVVDPVVVWQPPASVATSRVARGAPVVRPADEQEHRILTPGLRLGRGKSISRTAHIYACWAMLGYLLMLAGMLLE